MQGSGVGDNFTYETPPQSCDTTTSVIFRNRFKDEAYCSLEIEKLLQNDSRDFPQDKSFKLLVKLNGSPAAYTDFIFSDGSTRQSDGEGLIDIKIGEKLALKNLLPGTNFEVSEQNGELYDVIYEGTVNKSGSDTLTLSPTETGITGSLEAGNKANVKVSNRNNQIGFGKELTLTKNLFIDGKSSDTGTQEFEFTIKLYNAGGRKDNYKTYNVSYSRTGNEQAHKDSEFTFLREGQRDNRYYKASVRLYPGETITIKDLPQDAYAVISETTTGFITQWTGNITIEQDGTVKSYKISTDAPVNVFCKNSVTYNLPQTGGYGIGPYLLLGLGLILSSIMAVRLKKRRRSSY